MAHPMLPATFKVEFQVPCLAAHRRRAQKQHGIKHAWNGQLNREAPWDFVHFQAKKIWGKSVGVYDFV